MSIATGPQDAAAAALRRARPSDGEQDLPDREFLEAVAAGVRARRRAEVAELEMVAGWAGRHGRRGDGEKDPLVTPGGDGTPEVREYALPELAMARQEHTL